MSKKTWDKTSEPSQETKIGAGNESPKVPDKNLKKLHRGSDRLWNWSKRKSLTRDFLFSSISRVGVKFFDTFRSFEGKLAQLYFGAIANSDNRSTSVQNAQISDWIFISGAHQVGQDSDLVGEVVETEAPTLADDGLDVDVGGDWAQLEQVDRSAARAQSLCGNLKDRNSGQHRRNEKAKTLL